MNHVDILRYTFPISGVDTYLFIPPLVAFAISFFTSMAGISGAFLILPFQMSVLGFTAPAVSATNFLYNIVGTPGGIFRYAREKRMIWPLVTGIISGTLPGVMIGYYLRVKYLPEPKMFKLFVGAVLLFVGFRLVKGLGRHQKSFNKTAPGTWRIHHISYHPYKIIFSFIGKEFFISIPVIFFFSFIIGIVGGIYGIGGGAIIAPFCVSVLNIPVFAVAGAVLTANFVTSLAGISFYSVIPIYNGNAAAPDWMLGILFGIGGMVGMYLGARCQKHTPEKMIKLILALVIFTIAGRYITQYFY
ncbi:sulfite exporter TauE/SafE family protein [Thermodesulfobacteriota bacterium]